MKVKAECQSGMLIPVISTVEVCLLKIKELSHLKVNSLKYHRNFYNTQEQPITYNQSLTPAVIFSAVFPF